MNRRSQFGPYGHDDNPGRYRCLLSLQPSVEAQGGGGDAQPGWTATGAMQVHGSWQPRGLQSAARHIITETRFDGADGIWEMPWMPGLTTAHRIVYGTRKYRIVGIENIDERSRVLYVYCTEDEGAR